MKIGIFTFHYATNYGAVLQAYSLQEILKKIESDVDVEIVNYIPAKFRKNIFNVIKAKKLNKIYYNIKEYVKEKKINSFRKKHINSSSKYYSSYEDLVNSPPSYNIYICGSDQIWNKYFANKEGKTSYFLDFGNKNIKRISYAASFGNAENISDYNQLNNIISCLQSFDAISVRERNGIHILNSAGINNGVLVPDPTLLLKKEEYLRLFERNKKNKKTKILFYQLHRNQKMIKYLYYLEKSISNKIFSIDNYTPISIEEWLSYFYNTDSIITNSFHGVAFSLIFNKRFIALPIEGSLCGMNSRIETLLNLVNLSDRIVDDNTNDYKQILNKEIDWNTVNNKLSEFRKFGMDFITESICFRQ